ncbi:MAG: elongation factor Ts [Hyphomicrobiaceae bacterium]|jgi:elongation factor Ts
MSITAAVVKDLREKTGAGMMDCKRALTETNGDVDAAIAVLREKGLAGAAKKAGRVAAEGMVGVFQEKHGEAVLLELNCETDFVAKNPAFGEIVNKIGAGLLASNLDSGDGEAAAGVAVEGGGTIADTVAAAISSIGENVSLRRFQRLRADNGAVGAYVHGGGKIGVVVSVEGASADQSDVARDLAMQVAAAFPRYVRREEVPQSAIDTESEIFRNQALASGKPEAVIDRIIQGKINKFFGEICLLEQEFVKDSDLTVTKLLEKADKESGGSLTVTRFVRFQLGEGIEKKESNLAAEVAEQIAQGS